MRLLFCCCVLFVLVFGCAPVDVQTQFNESANFSNLRTYAWLQTDELPGDNVRVNNPAVVELVRGAVENSLRKKGYLKQDDGDVDFFVTWFGAIETKVKVESIEHFYGSYGYGTIAASMPVKAKEGERRREYEEGTIIIDVLDPKSHKPLWRGISTKRLLQGMNKKEADLYIKEVVNGIVAKFPPDGK